MDLCDNDEKKVDLIIGLKENIAKYGFFSRSVKLGITYTPKDLSFSDFYLFSLIKDAVENG